MSWPSGRSPGSSHWVEGSSDLSPWVSDSSDRNTQWAPDPSDACSEPKRCPRGKGPVFGGEASSLKRAFGVAKAGPES
eukprot:1577515-Amphidinium_carterae.1